MDAARLSRIFVSRDSTVREAIESIDAGAIEIALVVEGDRELVGTLTDGDVRRALLRGASLDDAIDAVVHESPVTAPVGTPIAALIELMTERGVAQVPLIEGGRVVDVAFLRDLVKAQPTRTPVVLMAGGEGQRLRPLTADIPKPMLPVGDRPLLETVLGQVREAGFGRVLMAVNYRADVIEEHFGDGSEHGLRIDYVREPHALGSAGALQLARDELTEPFIVMNADLLTNVNLGALLRFHVEDRNLITVAVRQYVLEVPYGVVELEDARVIGLREKPTVGFFVNAGIYAVDPAAVAFMPAGLEAFNMTDLIAAALDRGDRVGGFPIREYWLDVGQLSDYERAHDDHATYFSTPR